MTVLVYGALFAFLRFGRWGVRMRAAGQNPLLAAQRGINLHAVYALAWGLSTLTGSIAGMLIALDSGLDQTMVIIGLKAFSPALVGGLDSLVGALVGSLIVGRRRGAGHPLRRSAAFRRGAVPRAHRHADRAPLGSVRDAGGARPCLGNRAPAAISVPTTPRTSRWSGPGWSACSSTCFIIALVAFPLIASPFQLDLACQVFLACVGSLSLMLLTGYAGQISLGHAGLMAAGAFTVGILFRETNAPFWLTLPAAALVGGLLGVIFGLPSLRLRGLYLAVSTLALHFVVIYLGGEYESRWGYLDRHRHRFTEARQYFNLRWPRLVLHSAGGGRRHVAPVPQSVARAHRPGVAGDPGARDRRGGARHRHRRLQASRLRHQLGDHRGGGRALRLLPRLRVGRGVLAVPDDPVRRDDHRRRHGLAARRASGRGLRDALPLYHRSRRCSRCRGRSATPACCSP